MGKTKYTKQATQKDVASKNIKGTMCAWKDCDETINYTEDLPPEWRQLLVYWSPQPLLHSTLEQVSCSGFCDRDAVLCPRHARELESLLKDIHKWADRRMKGSA